MLDIADILNLVRLNELELQKIYEELESEDEETRNNAGEIVIQTENLAKKLKKMYEDKKPDYSVYPKYDDYIELIGKS
ncbi:hypothetical protein [Microbulbifer variabilis]|uniref:hypothetical protein n=1 Tax=Microbulbifer variabilis TaxID=266805 RepID=UPI0003A474FC|nr:hypothetical protein [Microbulbifer variabilis]